MTDADLLRTYAETRDQTVFADWVRRYTDGDNHRAQEIARQIFLTAARKAASPAIPCLSPYRTRLAAANLRQAEQCRLVQETAATYPKLASESISEPPIDWSRVGPFLDDAIATPGLALGATAGVFAATASLGTGAIGAGLFTFMTI